MNTGEAECRMSETAKKLGRTQCKRCQVWKLPEEFRANSSSSSCLKCTAQRREKRHEMKARPVTIATDGTRVRYCSCCSCDRPEADFSGQHLTCNRCRNHRRGVGKSTGWVESAEDATAVSSVEPQGPRSVLWSRKQAAPSHQQASAMIARPQPPTQEDNMKPDELEGHAMVKLAPVVVSAPPKVELPDTSQKQRCSRCQVWKLPVEFGSDGTQQCMKCTAKRKVKRQEKKTKKANNSTDKTLMRYCSCCGCDRPGTEFSGKQHLCKQCSVQGSSLEGKNLTESRHPVLEVRPELSDLIFILRGDLRARETVHVCESV